MARISSAAIWICQATLLKIIPTAAGLRLAPIRSGMVLGFGSLPGRLAKELGVSIPTVNEIVQRRRAVTAEMALRFSRYFQTSAELWQGLQAQHDLALARRKLGRTVKNIEPISRRERKRVAMRA